MLRFLNSRNTLSKKCVQKYLSCIASIINEGPTTIGEKATIRGWVKSLRSQKVNVFIDINDGSCIERLQVVISAKLKPDNLTWGSSVKVTGKIQKTPKGQIELVADEVDIIGECDVTNGYPFLPRHRYTPDYTRQYLNFRPRTNYTLSMLKVRDAATLAIYNFFSEQGFTHIHTPILTGNDCEGAGEVFRVQPESKELMKSMHREGLKEEEIFFGQKGFLSVSGQMHLEAVAHSISSVFTFGPTFRAENARSRLHLSEFYMLEAEIAFVDSLEPVLSLVESLIKFVARTIFTRCLSEVKFLRGEENTNCDWLDIKFPIITYDNAVDLLCSESTNCKEPPIRGEAFTKEHELLLVQLQNGVPTFVVDWPKSIKPFYMKSCSHDSEKVSGFDLLVPVVGELVGGSLREDNYDALRIKLPSDVLNWYLELRKYGSVPTGGFGLGFERLIQTLCLIPNIKDAIPFPRWPHNCSM